MRRLLRVIVSLGLLSLLAGIPIYAQGTGGLGTPEHPVVWVVSTEYSDDEEREALSAIAEDLGVLTGLRILLTFVVDGSEKVNEVAASDGNAFALLWEDEYIALYEATDGGVTPRVACVMYGYPYYFASVYAPRSSGIEALQDLNGRTWIYNDTASTTGYIFSKSLFEREGILISGIVTTGGHTNSMVALIEGHGDFCTGYGSAPGSPADWSGDRWEFGDDPEMWLWDRSNNQLFCDEFRGTCYDLRRAVRGAYDFETVLTDIGVVASIGPIPNGSLTFGPGFPADVAGRIVDAAQRHVSTEAGLSLWRASPYRVWGFEEIDDSFYDCYRSLLGLPIPGDRAMGACYYEAVDAPPTPAALPSPPVVSRVAFPVVIAVEQAQHGLVRFEDPEGDVVQVRLEILEGDPATLGIQPGTSFDPGVHGQTDGAFRFTITSSAAQIVTLRLTLVDEAGLESDPYEFTFEVQ